MLSNMKVGQKLTIGFLVVNMLAAIIGIMGINGVKVMNETIKRMYEKRVAAIVAVNELGIQVSTMRTALYSLPLADEAGKRAQSAEFDRAMEVAAEQFKILEATLLLPTCHELRGVINGYYDEFIRIKKAAVEEISKYELEVDPAIQHALASVKAPGDSAFANSRFMAGLLNNNVKMEWDASNEQYDGIFLRLTILLIISVVMGITLGWVLSRNMSKPLTATVAMINEMNRGNMSMRLGMNRGDEVGVMAKTMDAFAENMQTQVIGTMKMISNGDLSAKVSISGDKDEVGPALKDTIDSLRCLIVEEGGRVLQAAAEKDLTQRIRKEYRGEFARMKENINTVIEELDGAMGQVGEAVGQVTSASGEISQGAQSLAEGANEQASSLEEVSSSLEEMSSMTKQNADNSTQAKLLVGEASSSVSEANDAMTRMADAINHIKTSSDNTAKIIKTIDDIAFQTNLLALNAAVEAARAGEAGKGFAVVAEEVRNLAMRSAEAAKNTADMIEESVKDAENGVRITEDVAQALDKTVSHTSKVSDLINEIAAASNEQSQGIEQINTAVAQMNQVTQQNAANSEESASAAEELSSQASELANMVNGFKLSSSSGRPSGSRIKMAARPQHPRPVVAAIPDKRGNTGGALALSKPAAVAKSMKAVKAEEIIPLDDEDLLDF